MKNSIKKPNILFIITDDQGEWAVESEKNRDIKTPNLKRLANQELHLMSFIVHRQCVHRQGQVLLPEKYHLVMVYRIG